MEVEVVESYKISYGTAPSQFGVLYLPQEKKSHPVVVTIHGGFWKMPYGLDQFDRLDRILVQQGYAVWNIEYRRVGEQGGGWSGTFQDATASLNILKTMESCYMLDLSRVILLGHSAGGHLVLWLASKMNQRETGNADTRIQVPVKGVISLAGITDMREMWRENLQYVSDFMGGTPQNFPERYQYASPIDQLPTSIPQILVHGKADEDVPVRISQEYYEKAQKCGNPVELKIFPGMDHFDLIDPSSEAWKYVGNMLNRWTK